MSVDTKGYLKRKVSIFAVRNFIEAYFEVEVLIESGRLFFEDKTIPKDDLYSCRNRMLHFYEHDNDITPNQHPDNYPIVISLGKHGNSEEIIKKVIEEFGGWYMYSDCSEDLETEYGTFIEGVNPKYYPSDDDLLLSFTSKKFGHKNADEIAKLIEEAMSYGRRGGRNIRLYLDEVNREE